MRYQHIILAKPQTVRQRCTGNLTEIAPDPQLCNSQPLKNHHFLETEIRSIDAYFASSW
jgi:hypothetical protein